MIKNTLLFALGAMLLFTCGGCMSENTGLRFTIGASQVYPQVSTLDGDVSINFYESIEGLHFISRKDCRVTVEYTENHTNTYFGVIHKEGVMTVKATFEPVETSVTETDKGEVLKDAE